MVSIEHEHRSSIALVWPFDAMHANT